MGTIDQSVRGHSKVCGNRSKLTLSASPASLLSISWWTPGTDAAADGGGNERWSASACCCQSVKCSAMQVHCNYTVNYFVTTLQWLRQLQLQPNSLILPILLKWLLWHSTATVTATVSATATTSLPLPQFCLRWRFWSTSVSTGVQCTILLGWWLPLDLPPPGRS